MSVGQEIRIFNKDSVADFNNLGISQSSEAIPGLTDSILDYFSTNQRAESQITSHLITIGSNFDFEEKIFNLNKIKLFGFSISDDVPAFNVQQASNDNQTVKFFQLRSSDEFGEAGKIILNEICNKPELDIEEIFEDSIPNPSLPVVEKCETPLEIRIIYGQGINEDELDVLLTNMQKIFVGIIHRPVSVSNVLGTSGSGSGSNRKRRSIDTSGLDKMNWSSEYKKVILGMGINTIEQQIIENYKTDSLWNKVFSDSPLHLSQEMFNNAMTHNL